MSAGVKGRGGEEWLARERRLENRGQERYRQQIVHKRRRRRFGVWPGGDWKGHGAHCSGMRGNMGWCGAWAQARADAMRCDGDSDSIGWNGYADGIEGGGR